MLKRDVIEGRLLALVVGYTLSRSTQEKGWDCRDSHPCSKNRWLRDVRPSLSRSRQFPPHAHTRNRAAH